MFVKYFTNIPLQPSPSLEINSSKDSFIPKNVLKVVNLLALNDNVNYEFKYNF